MKQHIPFLHNRQGWQGAGKNKVFYFSAGWEIEAAFYSFTELQCMLIGHLSCVKHSAMFYLFYFLGFNFQSWVYFILLFHLFYFILFYFLLHGRTHGLWNFPGQGLISSHSYDFHHRIFNPLRQARDWSHTFAATRATAGGFLTHCVTVGTPGCILFFKYTEQPWEVQHRPISFSLGNRDGGRWNASHTQSLFYFYFSWDCPDRGSTPEQSASDRADTPLVLAESMKGERTPANLGGRVFSSSR